MTIHTLAASAALLAAAASAAPPLQPADVFALEHAADPQIAPDSARIAYVRVSADIMTDRFERSIWIASSDGALHRPLVQGDGSYASPRWSPSGDRIAFVASEDGASHLRLIYMDTLQTATIATLQSSPASLAWSPDGAQLAFTMFVEDAHPTPAALPPKPQGAEWAAPARVIDSLIYRADGQGFTDPGHSHIFVVPADGGSPRQLTAGEHDHNGPLSWSPDGASIFFSGNLADDAERNPIESNVYELRLADGSTTRHTDRIGPDSQPALSPDGQTIAYVGFDDRQQGYQVAQLTLRNIRTGEMRTLAPELDRDIDNPVWAPDGDAIYASFDDQGVTKLARFTPDGRYEVLAEDLGGATLGRPYPSGAFSVASNAIATIVNSPTRPADLAVIDARGMRTLTALNDDLLAHRNIPDAERITARSSADGREIEAWLIRPPHFETGKRYPLLLEIHGGPFANYGPRFSAEMQLFAAAGYVAVYANPRGSTSYGEEFGNLIHHAYPGDDYHDLMAIVDRAIEMGFVDPEQLFVTGGSGGGVLTAWIVGSTDRFRAAAVVKPVINWTSFALTADAYTFFWRYWFPGMPWDHPEHYWKRSPLSLVGNVSTPTMLMTGEADYRTPMSETEQYYQALRLRDVPTRLVRIPDASHGIASRPSRLLAKVSEILRWFEEHGSTAQPAQPDAE